MKWKPILLAAVLAMASVPQAAGEPVVVAKSATDLSATVNGSTIDLFLPNIAGFGAVLVQFSGFGPNLNYLVHATLTNTSSLDWAAVDAEIFAPAPPSNGNGAPGPGVPPGFTRSDDADGISFAQSSNLERSSNVFTDVFVDEDTSRDFLRYSGGIAPPGTETLLTFGLRDLEGSRTFLVAFSPTPTPEPATLLLIGTGVLGVVRASRQRRRSRA